MKRSLGNYLIAVLVIAIFFRVGFLCLSQRVLLLQAVFNIGDTMGYDQLARNILESASFRFATGQATAFRMPGYPVFLAAVYSIWDSKLAVQLVQILFDVLTIWVVYAVTRETTHQRFIWCVAPLFVAVNPLLIITSLTLIPETLTTAILAVAVWISVRLLHVSSLRSRMGLTALLFLTITGGIYLKPTVATVSIFAAAMLFTFFGRQNNWRQALRTLGIAAGVTVIALSIWIVRNYVVTETFVPLTTSTGANLYGGNNPEANGGYVSNLPYVLPGMTEIESNTVLTRRAIDWIMANPVRFLALLPRKAARHWSPVAFGTAEDSPLPNIVRSVAILVFDVLYLLVFLGWLTLVRSERQWEAAALLLVPLALFVPSLVIFGATRFALPSFPELAILAALGITQLWERLKWVRQPR